MDLLVVGTGGAASSLMKSDPIQRGHTLFSYFATNGFKVLPVYRKIQYTWRSPASRPTHDRATSSVFGRCGKPWSTMTELRQTGRDGPAEASLQWSWPRVRAPRGSGRAPMGSCGLAVPCCAAAEWRPVSDSRRGVLPTALSSSRPVPPRRLIGGGNGCAVVPDYSPVSVGGAVGGLPLCRRNERGSDEAGRTPAPVPNGRTCPERPWSSVRVPATRRTVDDLTPASLSPVVRACPPARPCRRISLTRRCKMSVSPHSIHVRWDHVRRLPQACPASLPPALGPVQRPCRCRRGDEV